MTFRKIFLVKTAVAAYGQLFDEFGQLFDGLFSFYAIGQSFIAVN